jgi:large repetitive protein
VTHVAAVAYHEVKLVGIATVSYVKHHAATIAGFAAGAAVFAGCEGLTLGVGTVGCAAAAGAAGSLVSYGMSCGSSSGGCSPQGALVSAGVGALGGAVGGVLAGPLGGKLASSIIGKVLPDLAVQGLAGAAAGAGAGGIAGAAAYGLGCRSTRQGCSIAGLATATGQGAAGALSSAGAARGSAAPEDAGLGASSVPRTAFRGDTRSPSEVEAAGGFQPRAPGSSTSLREYVFNSTPSNFVGASKLPELAAGPAFSGPGNYVYEVSTEGLSPIDVNAELGSHIFAAEHELAFPGGIPFGNILRAFKIQEPFVLGPEVPGWP